MAPARPTANRPKSPILNSSGDVIPNGPKYNKVNRIALVREANCEVIAVESPSVFWVRLSNHITDSEYLKPRRIEPMTYPTDSLRFKYVFAPRQRDTYRRARILRTADVNGEKLALVHFIDYGDRRWVGVRALAHMDNEYYFHPWQAIGCCLMAIAPKPSPNRTLDSNQQPMWTEEEGNIFRTVVQQFTDTKIEVVNGSVDSNDSRAMIKVNLFGRLKGADEEATTADSNDSEKRKVMDQAEQQQLESVGMAFARRSAKTVMLNRGMLDAQKQYQYEIPVSAEELTPPDPATLADWQLKLNADMEAAAAYSDRERHELWSNEYNPAAKGIQVPMVTLHWLEQNGYIIRDKLLIHVEGACTVSPYEFYARPLREKLISVEDITSGEEQLLAQTDAIIDANKEMQDFVDELNAYYGEPPNRLPIDIPAAMHALNNGDRVYGVVERTDDVAQFTGSWQRIELIARQDVGAHGTILVRLRYLDAGGTDIKQLDSIFEIQPKHAERPPFCIQFSLFGLLPQEYNDSFQRGGFHRSFDGGETDFALRKWSVAAKEAFKTLLREDVPLSANTLLGRLNQLRDKEKVDYLNEEPYKRPNVIFVKDLVVRGESSSNNESIDSQLVSLGYAKDAGNRDAPVEYEALFDAEINFYA